MRSLGADPAVELIAADMDPWAARPVPRPAAVTDARPGGGGTGVRRRAPRPVPGPWRARRAPDRRRRAAAAGRRPGDLPGARHRACCSPPRRRSTSPWTSWRSPSTAPGSVRVPRTEPLGAGTDPSSWTYPVIVKPRSGSGSRGIVKIAAAAGLAALDHAPGQLVQEFLPGAEFSIDVLAGADGHVIAAVPRLRARVDSGVSRGRADGARRRARVVRPGRRGGNGDHLRGQRPGQARRGGPACAA